MIWSGDRVPITANNDDAAVFYLLWSIAMLRWVLSIATESNISCQNHKYREGTDGTADSKIHQGMSLRDVQSGVWNSGNSA
jgi:hypothetical protein